VLDARMAADSTVAAYVAKLCAHMASWSAVLEACMFC
jgi:hypothetical protein